MNTIRIAMILAIALFGVLVISAVAVAPEAYAQSIPSGAQNGNSGAQNSNQQTSNNPLGSIVPGLDHLLNVRQQNTQAFTLR